MRDGGFVLPASTRNTPTFTRAYGFYTPDEARELQPDGNNRNWYRWPSPTQDPNFASTIGLWYFQPQDCTSWDVSNTAAALKDYSFAANNPLKAIAQTGSTFTAGLDDVSPLWGTHSGHIATGGCTGYQATAGAAFGTGDFTIEIIGTMISVTNTVNLVDFRNTTGAQVVPTIYNLTTDGTLRYFVSGADRIVSAAATFTSGRFMLALSRVSGNTRMYYGAFTSGGTINQVGSTYVDANNYIVANGFIIGGPNVASASNDMLLDAIRITKGVGRYSGASLTAPTQPFPAY